MKATDLPSPGALTGSLRLRSELAKAISYVESRARKQVADPVQLATLRAFLQAGVTRLDAIDAAGQ